MSEIILGSYNRLLIKACNFVCRGAGDLSVRLNILVKLRFLDITIEIPLCKLYSVYIDLICLRSCYVSFDRCRSIENKTVFLPCLKSVRKLLLPIFIMMLASCGTPAQYAQHL